MKKFSLFQWPDPRKFYLLRRRITLEIFKNFEIPLIYVFALLIPISSWMGDFEGGDIAAARKSYLSSSPIDIWGGFSGFFYGNIPETFFSWGLNLLILHMVCSSVGIILVRQFFLAKKIYFSRTIFLISSYLILNFSSFLTRDSTLLSFLLFGIGVGLKGIFQSHPIGSKLLIITGAISIVVACSFRPWISIPVVLLINAFIVNLKIGLSLFLKSLIIISIAGAPLAFDALVYVKSDLRNVHPELQVITMDSGSFSCYSNNRETRLRGVEVLESINNQNLAIDQICGNYQPNTWQSVAFWKLSKSDAHGLGLKEINYKNSQNLIAIPTDLDPDTYSKVRSLWIKTILSDPKNYAQIKISQFVQIFLAGDSAGLRVSRMIDDSSIVRILRGIALTPYDLIETLHLISPVSLLLFGMCYLLFRSRMTTVENVISRLDLYLLFLFPITWSAATAVAFIGDNGRYLYPSTLIFALLLNGFVPENRKMNGL